MTTKRIDYRVTTRSGQVRVECIDVDTDDGLDGSIVSVSAVNLRTPTDIDALIAALVTARDALDPRDVTPDEMAQLRENVHRAQAVVDELMAQPAAPSRATRGAVRLTRAQRELMEIIGRAPKFPYSASSGVWRRTSALVNRGLLFERADGFVVTPDGKAALTAQQEK